MLNAYLRVENKKMKGRMINGYSSIISGYAHD